MLLVMVLVGRHPADAAVADVGLRDGKRQCICTAGRHIHYVVVSGQNPTAAIRCNTRSSRVFDTGKAAAPASTPATVNCQAVYRLGDSRAVDAIDFHVVGGNALRGSLVVVAQQIADVVVRHRVAQMRVVVVFENGYIHAIHGDTRRHRQIASQRACAVCQ